MTVVKVASSPDIVVEATFDSGSIRSITLSLSPQPGLFFKPVHSGQEKAVDRFLEWLRSYAKKQPTDLTLFLQREGITPFRWATLSCLRQVPFGQTIAYGQLAKKVGNVKAARAVGSACHANPLPLLIPCHRVIRSDGSIGGFATNIEIKRRLLEFEVAQNSPLPISRKYEQAEMAEDDLRVGVGQ
jgi:methylated-DNA-[protein]-cysteine S-methyltransferase